LFILVFFFVYVDQLVFVNTKDAQLLRLHQHVFDAASGATRPAAFAARRDQAHIVPTPGSRAHEVIIVFF
jgi:hypothetical protein